MNFPIIYEDDECIVIDKPVGIMVHPDERQNEYTIADWMRETYNAFTLDVGREGIVHRLDRNTTGVLLLAKSQRAFNVFKKQFKAHTTRKVYRTIVEGGVKNEMGMIAIPLARAKSDFRKKTIVDPYSGDARGEEREAITRYKVLERVSYKGKTYTYLEVYPVTGRTHQIRAHFRGIRHPIIGDDLYGSKKTMDFAQRSMLHAYSLTLKVPVGDVDSGDTKSMTFHSPLHSDMVSVLGVLGFKKVD